MTGYLHLGHLYHLLWVYAYAEYMGVPVFYELKIMIAVGRVQPMKKPCLPT